jgi:hypothetical protein
MHIYVFLQAKAIHISYTGFLGIASMSWKRDIQGSGSEVPH